MHQSSPNENLDQITNRRMLTDRNVSDIYENRFSHVNFAKLLLKINGFELAIAVNYVFLIIHILY